MRDDEVGGLTAGAEVMVRAVVSSPPRMAGYPHLNRLEPSATEAGVWLDIGIGRYRYQIWVSAGALERVAA